jgi:hypothetical protein
MNQDFRYRLRLNLFGLHMWLGFLGMLVVTGWAPV